MQMKMRYKRKLNLVKKKDAECINKKKKLTKMQNVLIKNKLTSLKKQKITINFLLTETDNKFSFNLLKKKN